MNKKMICIVCPVGCHLEIDENNIVTGNNCPRGEAYAIKEVTAPTRVLTSTVRTISKKTPRLSVKTKEAVPKEKIFDIMKLLDDILIKKDLMVGDVIIKNVLNTNVDIIATKNLKI
ncbi:DUF1667 domain-containing protein [Acholeplasma sp. OttesenSCG-928-E16]|nr:DUF1667 domain-containing protein [Acholeplasma sp. OttesenSCG-928-E16]